MLQPRLQDGDVHTLHLDSCFNDGNTTTDIGHIHFCFIFHGYQERATDLSYLHHTVKAKAKEKGVFTDAKSSDSCVVGKETKVAAAAKIQEEGRSRRRQRDRLPFSREKNNESAPGCVNHTFIPIQ